MADEDESELRTPLHAARRVSPTISGRHLAPLTAPPVTALRIAGVQLSAASPARFALVVFTLGIVIGLAVATLPQFLLHAQLQQPVAMSTAHPATSSVACVPVEQPQQQEPIALVTRPEAEPCPACPAVAVSRAPPTVTAASALLSQLTAQTPGAFNATLAAGASVAALSSYDAPLVTSMSVFDAAHDYRSGITRAREMFTHSQLRYPGEVTYYSFWHGALNDKHLISLRSCYAFNVQPYAAGSRRIVLLTGVLPGEKTTEEVTEPQMLQQVRQYAELRPFDLAAEFHAVQERLTQGNSTKLAWIAAAIERAQKSEMAWYTVCKSLHLRASRTGWHERSGPSC